MGQGSVGGRDTPPNSWVPTSLPAPPAQCHSLRWSEPPQPPWPHHRLPPLGGPPAGPGVTVPLSPTPPLPHPQRGRAEEPGLPATSIRALGHRGSLRETCLPARTRVRSHHTVRYTDRHSVCTLAHSRAPLSPVPRKPVGSWLLLRTPAEDTSPPGDGLAGGLPCLTGLQRRSDRLHNRNVFRRGSGASRGGSFLPRPPRPGVPGLWLHPPSLPLSCGFSVTPPRGTESLGSGPL